MPDVLGRVEHPEGEAVKEIAGGEESHDWSEGEPGALPEEIGDGLKLGDIVLLVAAVLHQKGEDVVVLAAGVSGEQDGKPLEDNSPRK